MVGITNTGTTLTDSTELLVSRLHRPRAIPQRAHWPAAGPASGQRPGVWAVHRDGDATNAALG